jgi:hypothetical protein
VNLTLAEFAQIGELVAAIGTVLAVVVGFSQLRQQVKQSGDEREATLRAIEQELSLSKDQQKLAKEQLELTKNLFEVEFLTTIEDRFASDTVLKRRKHAATFLLDPPHIEDPSWDDLSDFIDFFQALGTIVRSGRLTPELAYKWFSYWWLHYYPAVSKYIYKARNNGKSITWADAVDLYERFRLFDLQNNDGLYSNPSETELKEFFEWEIRAIRPSLTALDVTTSQRRELRHRRTRGGRVSSGAA